MPAVSERQRRWAFSAAGRAALGDKAKDFQQAGKLPEKAMKKETESKSEDAAEGGKEEPGEKAKKKMPPSVSQRMNAHMRAKAGVKAY